MHLAVLNFVWCHEESSVYIVILWHKSKVGFWREDKWKQFACKIQLFSQYYFQIRFIPVNLSKSIKSFMVNGDADVFIKRFGFLVQQFENRSYNKL